MTVQTTNLFLLDDLEDASKTRELAESDRDALRAVAGWIKTFVARPHKEIGRGGTVCPFVPGALERKTLWLAAEHIAGRSVSDVVQLMREYKILFLETHPLGGDEATYKSMVVVFTDLSADRAKDIFDGVLEQLAIPSYADDGVVLGAFYERNEGTAIYNPNFHPFTPPVPFLLVRGAVTSDWKFFLDNEKWFNVWAHRWGELATRALAEELRRLPWRTTK